MCKNSYVSPFAPKRKSVFATLFGASEELFPFELQSNVNAPDVAQFANGRWKQMLEDGSADDFVAQIVKKYMPAEDDDDDEHPAAAAASADSVNSKKSSQSSQKTPRSKRKPAVVAAAPVQPPSAESNNDDEFDTAHHVIRICGVDNAKLLSDRGITQLSQLRGSPVAVLRDIVGDAVDVDLWPQMAALLADGHVWFDVDRLRASRHVRARSPPTRLAPHHSSQDDHHPASPPSSQAAPVTPKPSSRGKRANPASSSAKKGDSVRGSAKRSHVVALATPTRAAASTRVSTRSASKK